MATASINTVLLSGHVNHKPFAFSSYVVWLLGFVAHLVCQLRLIPAVTKMWPRISGCDLMIA